MQQNRAQQHNTQYEKKNFLLLIICCTELGKRENEQKQKKKYTQTQTHTTGWLLFSFLILLFDSMILLFVLLCVIFVLSMKNMTETIVVHDTYLRLTRSFCAQHIFQLICFRIAKRGNLAHAMRIVEHSFIFSSFHPSVVFSSIIPFHTNTCATIWYTIFDIQFYT